MLVDVHLLNISFNIPSLAIPVKNLKASMQPSVWWAIQEEFGQVLDALSFHLGSASNLRMRSSVMSSNSAFGCSKMNNSLETLLHIGLCHPQ